MSMTPGDVGAASDFPDGATVVGSVAGSAVASGDVGETQVFSYSGGTVDTTTFDTPVDVHSVSIPAGVWMVFGNYTLLLNTDSSFAAGSIAGGAIYFTDASNNLQISSPAAFTNPVTSQVNRLYSTCTFFFPLALSSSTTYKVRIVCNQSSSNAFARIENHNVALTGGETRNSAQLRILRIG